MEVSIGNCLIAERLGFQPNNHGWEDVKGVLMEEEEKNQFKLNELKFHSNWEWLMEAVKHCNSIPSTEDNEKHFKELYDAVLTFNKNNVWTAVLHFFQNVKE